MENAFSEQLHARVSAQGVQASLGFSPFHILVLLLHFFIFILFDALSLIPILVEVPPLIFYLGNTICFHLKRELHAQ